MRVPFAPGSVSLRMYPHNDLAAPEIVEELRAQALLASESGFDGVMTSEHHGGFRGYLPNPLQAAGWLLEAMPTGWAAPCPLLLPLRPPALVAEEVAWLAARFPGRVGLGVASGALDDDFAIMNTDKLDLTRRFADGLTVVAGMLDGTLPGRLAGDPAIARCAEHPVPMVSAAMGVTAVRRAARARIGIIFDSLSTPARCRELSDAYRDAGGTGPVVMIRRVWVGEPPRERMAEQLDVYRSYAASDAQQHWAGDQLVGDTDAAAVADGVADAMSAGGADSVNLRVHVPGVAPADVRRQIVLLGAEVIPALQKSDHEAIT
jgi:alkanesulfonate monooxygenase SsuD/methylene tetrahydromethanopterin reductase-like flavin-dependent oxidoreductase (luciferase family)